VISKHVDIVAVVALLLGILIWSEARQSVIVQIIKNRQRVRVERIRVSVPAPPVMPIVFE